MTRPRDRQDDFTIEHYREIAGAISRSHSVLSFKDAKELGEQILDIDRVLIMRHDVEFSLEAALRLAEADADAGLHSTFFLLQTSDYNCFEEQGADIIRKILGLGHDIGLHYDAALFERMGLDAETTARAQIALFETFFDTTIHAMSSHMPMRSGRTFAIDGVVDTYDPLYLVRMKYVSDSTQAWREGVVTDLLQSHDHIHLLTHEYIWHPSGYRWDSLLLIEAHTKFQAMWERALVNIETYREGLKLRKHKDKQFRKRFMTSDERDEDPDAEVSA